MKTNLGYEMTYKGATHNIPLYPSTTKKQIIDWDIGEIYGPFILELPVSGWSNKQQIVPLNGVTVNDKVRCVKMLVGTEEQMKAQDFAYGLLDPKIGIESFNNQIKFTCTNEVPNVDIQVQVMWTK